MKRLLSLLLCLLMISVAIAGCKSGGSGDGSTGTPTTGSVPGTDGETTGDTTTPPATTELSDGLEGVTFDGTTINVPYRVEMQLWYEGAEEGNIVYQSIYNANLVVEERLEIKRNFIPLEDAKLTSTITNSIMSDLTEYDYVSVDQYYGPHHVASGVYADLSDADYLDFTKPWYYQDYMASCNLGKDAVFYIAGDASTTILNQTVCLYVNKGLYTDTFQNDFSEMYQMIYDREWTVDKYMEMCQDVFREDSGNGDGIYGSAQCGPATFDHFAYSLGLQITEKNEDGFFDIVLVTEKNQNIIDKVNDLLYNTIGSYTFNYSTDRGLDTKLFTNNRLLFYPQYFASAFGNLSETEIDYAIIPRPMYDENQEDYISTVQNSCFLIAVATNVPADKMGAVCATIEAQGFENYKDFYPTFMETAMKVQKGDTENYEDASNMIDIIHDTLYVDSAYIYSYTLEGIGNITSRILGSDTSSISQYYAGITDAVAGRLQLLIDTFNQNFEWE